MGFTDWMWNLLYLRGAPWDMGGPRPELVRLLDNTELQPERAIDLGCGTGDNAIYLAQQGLATTGVDISSRAIAEARRRAQEAGVSVRFLVCSVTDPHGIAGPFDLVVDNGCLHSLPHSRARDDYVRTLLRLTRPGSRYFLRLFVKERSLFFGWLPHLSRSEVARRFGHAFVVEAHETGPGEAPFGMADATDVYWMRRKEGESREQN